MLKHTAYTIDYYIREAGLHVEELGVQLFYNLKSKSLPNITIPGMNAKHGNSWLSNNRSIIFGTVTLLEIVV